MLLSVFLLSWAYYIKEEWHWVNCRLPPHWFLAVTGGVIISITRRLKSLCRLHWFECYESTRSLNPIIIGECGGHLFEKYGYNLCCFNFGNTISGAEGLDEVEFVHGVPFWKCLFLDRTGNIGNVYNSVTVSVKRVW